MTITIFGKRVITTYYHLYYRLSYHDLIPTQNGRLTVFDISKVNYEELNLSNALKRMLDEQPNYVKGYGFRDLNGNIIGHLFLMKKGGTEILYKIRNIDAYVFAVRTFEEFRGRGYAGEMISLLAEHLKRNGHEEMYLTVKKDNSSAIKVYDRLGFKLIGKKFFVRVGKYNIPYLTL